MTAAATAAAAGVLTLPLNQLSALRDCEPTLCRFPQGWRRAPTIGAGYHSNATVRALLAGGFLEQGGEGWLKLTAKGRAAAANPETTP